MGQGITCSNLFTYCLNNPVLFLDRNGRSASLPPMIENGLNLPTSGGIPIEINGTTYYYAIDMQNGEIYEYWFDADGNLVWGRHHSTHNKPWKHKNPHDHKGGKDKNGNNTLVDGPQPVDENFRGPNQSNFQRNTNLNAGYVVAGAVVGVVVYQIAKWAIATILAPPTGGTSYAVAALTP
jgi:hypothetical protein